MLGTYKRAPDLFLECAAYLVDIVIQGDMNSALAEKLRHNHASPSFLALAPAHACSRTSMSPRSRIPSPRAGGIGRLRHGYGPASSLLRRLGEGNGKLTTMVRPCRGEGGGVRVCAKINVKGGGVRTP